MHVSQRHSTCRPGRRQWQARVKRRTGDTIAPVSALRGGLVLISAPRPSLLRGLSAGWMAMCRKREEQLNALRAHRAALLRDLDEAQASGDEKALQLTDLLLRQCNYLLERAEREERDASIMKCKDE